MRFTRPSKVAQDESQSIGSAAIGPTPCLLLLVSGGLALVYELLWMRRFAVVFGATTPAVSATLAAVFLGLASGSAVLGARAVRFANPLRAYGLLEIGAGLGALLVEPTLRLYDLLYPALHAALSGSAPRLLVVKTLLAVVALFAPTFFLGGTVPVLSEAFDGDRRRLGISAGGLYAANTFGAVAGALSVPFFWLPRLGATASYGTCVVGSISERLPASTHPIAFRKRDKGPALQDAIATTSRLRTSARFWR